MLKMLRKLLTVAAAAVLLGACARARTSLRSGAAETVPAAGAGDAALEEASLRGKTFQEETALSLVHFDYDRYSLSEDALGSLRQNAKYLRAHPQLNILVEGHCDDRGTMEYNIALGQRRAHAIRDYYVSLGIPRDSIATISFGEERMLCLEQTEPCHRRNRRAHTKVGLKAEISRAH